jgi:hypothetical protein
MSGFYKSEPQRGDISVALAAGQGEMDMGLPPAQGI